MRTWQLQEAKAHLSDLVREASLGKPQEITLRGNPAVVVLSTDQYQRLVHPKPSLVDFLQQSPLAGIDIKITRDKSPPREIDL